MSIRSQRSVLPLPSSVRLELLLKCVSPPTGVRGQPVNTLHRDVSEGRDERRGGVQPHGKDHQRRVRRFLLSSLHDSNVHSTQCRFAARRGIQRDESIDRHPRTQPERRRRWWRMLVLKEVSAPVLCPHPTGFCCSRLRACVISVSRIHTNCSRYLYLYPRIYIMLFSCCLLC